MTRSIVYCIELLMQLFHNYTSLRLWYECQVNFCNCVCNALVWNITHMGNLHIASVVFIIAGNSSFNFLVFFKHKLPIVYEKV